MSTKVTKLAPAAGRVIISVSGGVAELVSKSAGVEVAIFDYDVDGQDDPHLHRDSRGQPCCIQYYPAKPNNNPVRRRWRCMPRNCR